MDWTEPPQTFRFILFERVNPTRNEDRFYYLGWLPTLFGWGVVRVYGRRGGSQRLRVDPFPDPAAAWPTIRRCIRTRLRHRYQAVATVQGV